MKFPHASKATPKSAESRYPLGSLHFKFSVLDGYFHAFLLLWAHNSIFQVQDQNLSFENYCIL